MKDPKVVKFKVQTWKKTSVYHPKQTETPDKKVYIEKKKYHEQKQAQKNSTPTISINISSTFGKAYKNLS